MKRVPPRSARRRAVTPAPRCILATLAPLLILVASLAGVLPVRAASGLYLTWDDCPLSGSAFPNMTSFCDVSTGQNILVAAFTMPQPRDSVLGVEVVVDVQHSSPSMPDWWHFETGGCRTGALSQSGADFTGLSGCVDPWQGNGFGGIQGYSIGPPDHPMSNQSRIKVVAAVIASSAASLDATSMYYAVKIVISNEKTAPPGQCTGCQGAACLVLNSILVRRIPGSSGDEFLQTPGPANANWATWQGTAADCSMVPVRRATWGRLKSLYR